MAKLILPGISSSDLSTLVLDKKGLVYDLDNNQIVYGDGTATGGLLLGGMSALNISAGTTSSNATNFVFSNANSVTFGMTGKTITASFNAAGGGLTNINLSAGTTSNNLSKFQFNDSNGVSFGLNGSTITATVKTDYLTTAMQSNAATISNINVSAGTTSNLLSAVTFADANSISFGLNGSVVTAIYAHNHTNNIYATGNTTQSSSMTNDNRSITFRGEGIASVGASNNSIIISATQSNQAFSAGGGSSAFQTLAFNDANGISFSNNGGSVQASYTVPTVTNSSFSVQDSATAINPVNRIAFSTGNNITLSLSTGAGSATVGIAHNLAGTSTGFGGNLISASMTHNSSGLNLSLNHPAWLTTAMQSNAATISNIRVSAGTTSNLMSALTFADGNGISFGINASTITASHNALTTARASTDAIGLNTAKTNVTWTVNSSGLSIDAGGYAGTSTGFTGANISGSFTHNTAGLAMSLSVAAPGGGAAINVSAGTTSNNLQSVVFADGNNVSFGLGTGASSQSITASFNPVGYTALSFQNRQLGASTTILAGGGQNSLWLAPARIGAPVSASTILAAIISYSGTITSAATAQAGHTIRVGIWSQHTDPASTSRFDTWWTGAASITFWNSGTSSVSYNYSLSGGNTTGSSAGSNLMTASVMGARNIIMPIGSTMPSGLYVFGLLNSTSTAGYSAAMSRMAAYFDNPLSLGMGTFGQGTNNSIGYADGGTYLTTTGGLPSSLALNQIGAVANVMPFFKVGAI